jgi:hypothetical protein
MAMKDIAPKGNGARADRSSWGEGLGKGDLEG